MVINVDGGSCSRRTKVSYILQKGSNQNRKKLEWYVLNYDFNKKKIEYFNIFQHSYLVESLKEYLSNDNFNYSDYIERVDRLLRYCFWSKREYEISVADAFETDISKLKKIDVYFQLKPNIEKIAEYFENWYFNNFQLDQMTLCISRGVIIIFYEYFPYFINDVPLFCYLLCLYMRSS